MTEGPETDLGDLDISAPSAARIYDYFLGGAHNFAVDRAAAEDLAHVHPAIGQGMRANRSFLRRAIVSVAGRGIDQFLDLGSGIPTVGNVHEIVQKARPEARVVYVDIEPVAVTHSLAILQDNARATAVHADLRQPEHVLDNPAVGRLLDLDQPVALILAGVLQYVPEADDPVAIIARYRDRLPRGSFLIPSHPTTERLSDERGRAARAASTVYDRTATPFTYRSASQFSSFLEGWEVVEPGVTSMAEWRAETSTEARAVTGRANAWVAVARKP